MANEDSGGAAVAAAEDHDSPTVDRPGAVPVVLVHGNPETAAVWDLLLVELDRDDVTRLSPPGFGAPLTARSPATMMGYRDWLVARLEEFRRPVDLVGHDWGGAHVLNVAQARPDLLHSWVTDAAGLFDPAYVWHPLAQVWQTPGDGERAVAALMEVPLGERTDAMLALGVPHPVAERVAAGQDVHMGRAILSLYRSARQPALAEAGRRIEAAAARPGLVLSAGADDMTGTEDMRRRVARRAGAAVVTLPGVGHWWMTQDPAGAAAALTAFWNRHG